MIGILFSVYVLHIKFVFKKKKKKPVTIGTFEKNCI